MHNKSYHSLLSLWAAHAGIPSFTEAWDSYLTADSNTTPEFKASSQEYCILVKLLRHLHQHKRIALTAVRPASIETTWIMMFKAIHVDLYIFSRSLLRPQSSSCCKEQWQHTLRVGLVNRQIELEEQNGLCYPSLPLASSFWRNLLNTRSYYVSPSHMISRKKKLKTTQSTLFFHKVHHILSACTVAGSKVYPDMEPAVPGTASTPARAEPALVMGKPTLQSGAWTEVYLSSAGRVQGRTLHTAHPAAAPSLLSTTQSIRR